MPFFSVIIPLYNKEKYIQNTLKSVLFQTFADFEVIIVNDGSTDTSEQKVLAFEDSRIRYYSKENGGVSSARNFGMEKAHSDHITFIDADDYWYPGFLDAMHAAICRFPDEHVFSAAIEIEMPNRIFPAQYSIVKTDDFQVVPYFEASRKETAICTSCAVFHKSVFEKAGNFDVDLKSGQDTDMWIRIGMDYDVLFCWTIFARYVFDPESLSKNKAFVRSKINFSKYEALEKTHPQLKRFLDGNRFSLAIKSKVNNDHAHFKALYSQIDLANLSPRKRILLVLPAFVIRKLIRFQHILSEYGLESSVFK